MPNKFYTSKNFLSDTTCMTSESKSFSKRMSKASAAGGQNQSNSDISKVIIHYNHLTE